MLVCDSLVIFFVNTSFPLFKKNEGDVLLMVVVVMSGRFQLPTTHPHARQVPRYVLPVSAVHLSDMLGGSRGSPRSCAKEVWTTSPAPKTMPTTIRVVMSLFIYMITVHCLL